MFLAEHHFLTNNNLAVNNATFPVVLLNYYSLQYFKCQDSFIVVMFAIFLLFPVLFWKYSASHLVSDHWLPITAAAPPWCVAHVAFLFISFCVLNLLLLEMLRFWKPFVCVCVYLFACVRALLPWTQHFDTIRCLVVLVCAKPIIEKKYNRHIICLTYSLF